MLVRMYRNHSSYTEQETKASQVWRASTRQPSSRNAKDEDISHTDSATRAARSQAPHFRSPATAGMMLGPNTTAPYVASLSKTSMAGRGTNPAYMAIAMSSGYVCLTTSLHPEQNAILLRRYQRRASLCRARCSGLFGQRRLRTNFRSQRPAQATRSTNPPCNCKRVSVKNPPGSQSVVQDSGHYAHQQRGSMVWLLSGAL
jgi:hypothetical protein